jgi:hypothetical protein
LDEAQKSVMYDGKFSHQEENLTHRKCFLIYDEFSPELIPQCLTLNVRKNILLSTFAIFKGTGSRNRLQKFDKKARSWPKKGRRQVFNIFQKLIEKKLKFRAV